MSETAEKQSRWRGPTLVIAMVSFGVLFAVGGTFMAKDVVKKMRAAGAYDNLPSSSANASPDSTADTSGAQKGAQQGAQKGAQTETPSETPAATPSKTPAPAKAQQ